MIITVAVVSGDSGSAYVKENEKSNLLPMASENYDVYPYDVIDYSVSCSSFIEFKLNFEGEVENLQITESLGIPFDKSIIDGLNNYAFIKIISAINNFSNQYRL